MRRSLSGLVPEEILQRRRKASVSRSPVKALQESYPLLRDLFRPSLVAERGIIDDAAFLTALEGAMAGEIDWLSGLIATVKLEQWLRSVQRISHDAPTILNDLARMRGELTTERR
jgi:asparagine synthase (glutamine-hydrolysing)